MCVRGGDASLGQLAVTDSDAQLRKHSSEGSENKINEIKGFLASQ